MARFITIIKNNLKNYFGIVLALFLITMITGGKILFLSNFIWSFSNKFLHLLTYFLIAFFLYLGIRNRIGRTNSNLFEITFALLGVAILAAIDELGQIFSDSRTPNFDDWLLDLVGGILLCSVIAAIVLMRKIWDIYSLYRHRKLLEQVRYFEDDPE